MARPRTGRKGVSLNLYIDRAVKRDSMELAVKRLKISLSDLVEELLIAELKKRRAA